MHREQRFSVFLCGSPEKATACFLVSSLFQLHPTLPYIVCYVTLTHHLRATVLPATREIS